jgi:hypothetical protein
MEDVMIDESKDKRTAYINIAIWGGLTFLFCCGGGALTGFLASGSEEAGVSAAMASTGPACCAISGLAGAVPGLFALKGKTGLKFALPVILGILGGIFGGAGIAIFMTAIFPSL